MKQRRLGQDPRRRTAVTTAGAGDDRDGGWGRPRLQLGTAATEAGDGRRAGDGSWFPCFHLGGFHHIFCHLNQSTIAYNV